MALSESGSEKDQEQVEKPKKKGKAQPGQKKLSPPDSQKVDIIRDHRHWLLRQNRIPELFVKPARPSSCARSANRPFELGFGGYASTFKKYVPIGLEPILLSEMDENQDKVYGSRLLRLTLVEDPMIGITTIITVGQDEQGKVVRLTVYNVPQNEQLRKLVAFGNQLGIVSPCHKMAVDGKGAIRVNDPSWVVHFGKRANMCRYCGGENSKKRCSICKLHYCSRKCQLADWKFMNHKVICGT